MSVNHVVRGSGEGGRDRPEGRGGEVEGVGYKHEKKTCMHASLNLGEQLPLWPEPLDSLLEKKTSFHCS